MDNEGIMTAEVVNPLDETEMILVVALRKKRTNAISGKINGRAFSVPVHTAVEQMKGIAKAEKVNQTVRPFLLSIGHVATKKQ